MAHQISLAIKPCTAKTRPAGLGNGLCHLYGIIESTLKANPNLSKHLTSMTAPEIVPWPYPPFHGLVHRSVLNSDRDFIGLMDRDGLQLETVESSSVTFSTIH